MRNRLFLFSIIACFVLVGLAFAIKPGNSRLDEKAIPQGKALSAADEFGDYHLKILVLEEGDVLRTHFEQCLVYNVTVDSVPVNDLRYYDLIVVRGDVFDEQMVRYVKEGGFLCVFGGTVPGLISSIEEGSFRSKQPVFPTVKEEFQEIQQVFYDWAEVYPIEYRKRLDSSFIGNPIMQDVESGAIIIHKSVGEGNLLWFADVLNFEKYSVSLSFDDDKPFHPGLATLTSFLADEIVHYVSLKKYGFSLERPLGPYGTPMMAWQNHYEASHAFARKDYSRWYNLLKEYKQIPTFSIIRGSFNWGRWKAGVSISPNVGDKYNRVYDGYTNNSFYTTGIILRDEGGYLEFGTYPAFRTLLSKLGQPFRTVPQLVDGHLLIGTPSGHVYVTEPAGEWQYVNTRRIDGVQVDSLAAPYYENGHLLLGGKNNIKIYRDEGNFMFTFVGYVQHQGKRLSLQGPLVPAMKNDVLYVGDMAGNVYLLKNNLKDFNFKEKVRVLTTENPAAAPFPFDWNNDGHTDLLVGGKNGKVGIYLNIGDQYEFNGNIKGRNPNFFFTREIKVGQYSVPRLTPQGDLLLGGAMYGIPYSIDDQDFPYREHVAVMAEWAREKQLTLGAHVDLNPSMPPELESKAYVLHRQAFEELGIPWENMGINHHSWYITNPIQQSFALQVKNDIKFNFGFRPPGIPGAPKDGRHFALARPFIYEPIAGKGILLYQPAADISAFEHAWEVMTRRHMPLTYFQHVEYLNHQLEDLSQLINDLEGYRKRHGYVFSTEHQIAKSIMSALQTNLHVKATENGLTITPIRNEIAEWVGAYATTAGVVVRTAKDTKLYTDSLVQRYTGKRLTLGLLGTQHVSFGQNIRPSWWITATNSPLQIKQTGGKCIFRHIRTAIPEASGH